MNKASLVTAKIIRTFSGIRVEYRPKVPKKLVKLRTELLHFLSTPTIHQKVTLYTNSYGIN